MKIVYKPKDVFNVFSHTAIGTDVITWFSVLKKNRFAVQLPFLPKALFISVVALLNTPFQLFERIWFGKKISRSEVRKPVFILGHPRSGTTFLQYLLGQDPSFAYCSAYEGLVPHFFLTGGKPLQRAMQLVMPATRPQDNVRVSASLPVEEEFAMANISETSWVHGLYFPDSLFKVLDEEVIFSSADPGISIHWKKRFLFFLKKLSYRYPDKTLLLKSPANTGRLKEIHELFPDARFIHIHRNPYEVYQSNERLYEKILPLVSFHRADEKNLREYIFSFYERVYKKYLHDKQFIPDNQLMEFSYEDFVADPVSMMEKAYTKLSLGDFTKARGFLQKEIMETSDYKKNIYSSMDQQVKDRINTQWKFAFEAFGYKMN